MALGREIRQARFDGVMMLVGDQLWVGGIYRLHGHKPRARTVDGYKSHLGIDPNDELITGVAGRVSLTV